VKVTNPDANRELGHRPYDEHETREALKSCKNRVLQMLAIGWGVAAALALTGSQAGGFIIAIGTIYIILTSELGIHREIRRMVGSTRFDERSELLVDLRAANDRELAVLDSLASRDPQLEKAVATWRKDGVVIRKRDIRAAQRWSRIAASAGLRA
jgi:hypothetical protein